MCRPLFNPGTTSLKVTLATCLLLCFTTAYAQPPSTSSDPLIGALKEIESADWNHRWTGYGIALAGSAVGLGIGGWGLYAQPLARDGRPDPIIFAASALITGTATTQIVHGGMRLNERIHGATQARALLKDAELRSRNGLFFLEARAASARSTRFWGGLMTTAQGIGTTTLGARLWHKGSGNLKVSGMVFTGMGAVNTLIGLIHFPGKPRSGRILDRTRERLTQLSQFHLQPSLLSDGARSSLPGLVLSGRL